MRRFVEGMDRGQRTLFPECLEDWLDVDNSVRVVDVFVDELGLGELGFGGVDPEIAGRLFHAGSLPRRACRRSCTRSHAALRTSPRFLPIDLRIG